MHDLTFFSYDVGNEASSFVLSNFGGLTVNSSKLTHQNLLTYADSLLAYESQV